MGGLPGRRVTNNNQRRHTCAALGRLGVGRCMQRARRAQKAIACVVAVVDAGASSFP